MMAAGHAHLARGNGMGWGLMKLDGCWEVLGGIQVGFGWDPGGIQVGFRLGLGWYGMVWDGISWHGMAWRGMAWDGMGWHGMT